MAARRSHRSDSPATNTPASSNPPTLRSLHRHAFSSKNQCHRHRQTLANKPDLSHPVDLHHLNIPIMYIFPCNVSNDIELHSHSNFLSIDAKAVARSTNCMETYMFTLGTFCSSTVIEILDVWKLSLRFSLKCSTSSFFVQTPGCRWRDLRIR